MSNGMISFISPIYGWGVNYFPRDDQGMISPFNYDIRPGYFSDDKIYTRQSQNQADLDRLTDEIRSYGCTTFTAHWFFVVTWYRVTYFGGSSNNEACISI